MPHHQETSSAMLTCLREARERLEILIPKLREASERCAESSKPLTKLANVDGQKRKEMMDNIRAANRQWEEMVLRIGEVFALLESIQDNRQRGSV